MFQGFIYVTEAKGPNCTSATSVDQMFKRCHHLSRVSVLHRPHQQDGPVLYSTVRIPTTGVPVRSPAKSWRPISIKFVCSELIEQVVSLKADFGIHT